MSYSLSFAEAFMDTCRPFFEAGADQNAIIGLFIAGGEL